MGDHDKAASSELALASPIIPSRDTRQSAWTCRLPADLMVKICRELKDQGNLGTLSRLQLISSCLYTLVTPYLYRHLKLNQSTAIHFFKLFSTFPQKDYQLFFKPVPAHSHLLDLHIIYRLRSFLSYTITFTFTLLEGPQPVPMDYIEVLESYKDLTCGLSIFNAPILWPGLARTVIDLRPSLNDENIQTVRTTYPSECIMYFESIFAKLHPKQMRLILPESNSLDVDHYADNWSYCLRHLRAESIRLYDFCPFNPDGLPQASSTLRLQFRPTEPLTPEAFELGIRCMLSHREAMRHVDLILLFGLLPPAVSGDGCDQITSEQAFEMIRTHVRDLSQCRISWGNMDEFVIMPDTSHRGLEAMKIFTVRPQVIEDVGSISTIQLILISGPSRVIQAIGDITQAFWPGYTVVLCRV